MAIYGELTNSIVRQINRSRRQVTILFTDIEDSTQYWDKHGDVKGRLMVDQHNRLTFPVIRRYRGKVIKTIGDAIMASFRRPEDALKAAVGIQQALADMREKDRSFQLRVRIGLHTGKGIVEDDDVYGNVVNVAARVEAQGKGDQILLSAATAAKVSNREYCLASHGSFAPKGKRSAVNLYRCDWKRCPDLIGGIRYADWLPLVPRQKRDLLIYMAAFIGAVYFLYLKYLRFAIADSEELALLFLNPGQLLEGHPVTLGVSAAAFTVLVILFLRLRFIPRFLPYLVKGGFGFALAVLLVYWPVRYFEPDWGGYWEGVLHESRHLFVEVLEQDAGIYRRPTITSERLMRAGRGDLLLLSDTTKSYGYTWNKVLIGPGEYGWVERVTPRGQRVTWTEKFYFRYRDLYLLLAGCLGFVWGVFDFRVKPA